jgi:hypothetical protein
LVNSVEDNQLDIVIGFLDGEFNELSSGSFDGNGVAGKSGER